MAPRCCKYRAPQESLALCLNEPFFAEHSVAKGFINGVLYDLLEEQSFLPRRGALEGARGLKHRRVSSALCRAPRRIPLGGKPHAGLFTSFIRAGASLLISPFPP